MTTSPGPTTTNLTRFRVFPAVVDDDPTTEELNRQLPFLNSLCRQFQTVTGWEIGFQPKPHHVPGKTVFGQLSITDLAVEPTAGTRACQRQHCDQLVSTLDELLALIQDDRQLLDESTTCLAPVVDIPFSWWSLAGSAGYCRGQIASWAITSGERIRLMGGQTSGDCAISQTIGAVATMATFEAVAGSDLSLQQATRLSTEATQRARAGRVDLEWLAGVELDPITGEFEIAGHQASCGIILVDVDAQTAMEVKDPSDTLTAGQVLVLGASVKSKVEQLNQELRERELTCAGVADLIESMFGQAPVLVIYRR